MEYTKFYLKEEFIHSVTIHKVIRGYSGHGPITCDKLMESLTKGNMTSISSSDSPEFAKLRNELEDLHYIKTRRNCWNGDEVLIPFSLNDILFNVDDTFPCAGAMDWKFKNN